MRRGPASERRRREQRVPRRGAESSGETADRGARVGERGEDRGPFGVDRLAEATRRRVIRREPEIGPVVPEALVPGRERGRADDGGGERRELRGRRLADDRVEHGADQAAPLRLGCALLRRQADRDPRARDLRQLVERLARPRRVALERRQLDEHRLPRRLAAERRLERELEPVDLRQALAFQAAIAREVEQGAAVGEDGLHALAGRGGHEREGGREVAQHVARDLGAEGARVLAIEVVARRLEVAEGGVRAAERIGAAGRVAAGTLVRHVLLTQERDHARWTLAWRLRRGRVLGAAGVVGAARVLARRFAVAASAHARSASSSRCRSPPVISARSGVSATLISLRTPKSPGR